MLISKQHAKKGKRGRETDRYTDRQTETLRETDRETETEGERERLYKDVKISMKDQPYVAAMAVQRREAQAVAGS